MKKALRILMIFALLALPLFSPVAVAKGWEPLRNEKPDSRVVAYDSDIQIKTGRGVIYITTNKPLNIKIFTILGSQIANDNLSAGTFQFAVPAHGVYIIKAGDLTCKIAV